MKLQFSITTILMDRVKELINLVFTDTYVKYEKLRFQKDIPEIS